MKLKAGEIADVLNGRLVNGRDAGIGAAIDGVAIDSRKDCRGKVFFALKGPNFDGHDFLADVFARGAAAAVVHGKGPFECPPSAPLIEVEDTLLALGALAAHVRRGFKKPVIAVSGSAGKTTTKDMTASILNVSGKVLKTEGNKNNLIGMPLTLFGLDDAYDAAVVELGISEPGEMEKLVSICRPDIAVLTNIGRGHLERFGSIEGVAAAKGPLFKNLGPDGVRVVNLDDPWVVRVAGEMRNAVTYSLHAEADVTVRDYSDKGLGGVSVTYGVRGDKASVRFNGPGLSNVINGAAAIAASLPLGASIGDMEEGLGSFPAAKGRMGVFRFGGLTVLDDTYNANPESVAEALATLKKAGGRKVAVLGDMLELGAAAKNEHREAGRLAGTLGIDIVVAIGGHAADLIEGAADAGVKGAYGFNGRQEAAKALGNLLRPGDTVLVKGSRAMGLERIVEGLRAERS